MAWSILRINNFEKTLMSWTFGPNSMWMWKGKVLVKLYSSTEPQTRLNLWRCFFSNPFISSQVLTFTLICLLTYKSLLREQRVSKQWPAAGVKQWSSAALHYRRLGLCTSSHLNYKCLNPSSTPLRGHSSDRDTNHSLERGAESRSQTEHLRPPHRHTSAPIILQCSGTNAFTYKSLNQQIHTSHVETNGRMCSRSDTSHREARRCVKTWERKRSGATSSVSIERTAEYNAGTKW